MRPPGIFTLARWGMFAALLLGAAAIGVYPGGTSRDPSTVGYSFFHNMLSDLGSTVTLGGHRNPAGALLIAVTAVLFGVSMLAGFAGFARLYSATPRRRHLARSAGVVALVSCAAMAGIALAQADRSMTWHMRLSLLAVTPTPAFAAAFFALATAGDRRFPRGVPAAWLAMTLVLFALFAARWGPPVTTDAGLVFHVTVQKLAVFSALGVFVYQTYQAERVAARAAGVTPRHS